MKRVSLARQHTDLTALSLIQKRSGFPYMVYMYTSMYLYLQEARFTRRTEVRFAHRRSAASIAGSSSGAGSKYPPASASRAAPAQLQDTCSNLLRLLRSRCALPALHHAYADRRF